MTDDTIKVPALKSTTIAHLVALATIILAASMSIFVKSQAGLNHDLVLASGFVTGLDLLGAHLKSAANSLLGKG